MRISDWSSDVCSSDLRGELAQPRDAVLGGGMGGEQAVGAMAVQRIDDEHVGRCRIALGGAVLDATRRAVDLLQRRGKPQGLSADLRAGAVGGILAGPRDRSEEHTSELPSLMRSSYAVL